MSKRTAGIRVAVLLSAVVAVAAAHADTYTVNSTVDAVDATPGDGICATAGGACTLRAAVQEANAHAGSDVITMTAGVYQLSLVGPDEDAAATGDLDIGGAAFVDGLQINGAGAETTIIDGMNSDRVIDMAHPGPFAIRDVTIRGGNPPAEKNQNLPSGGGGIRAYDVPGGVTIERVTFRNNSSGLGGGLTIPSLGPIVITGATFDGNTSTGDGSEGSALYVQGTNLPGEIIGPDVTITDTTFTGNHIVSDPLRSFGGAAGFQWPGALHFTNVAFENNDAANGPSGLVVLDSISPITLTGCTFDGNSAQFGAAMSIQTTGAVSITDATMTNNDSPGFSCGGGEIQGDTVTITGGDVSDNGGGVCGGLGIQASNGVTIDGTRFRRNTGGLTSGGVYVTTTGGSVSLTNVEASENSGASGGGVAVGAPAGDITLTKVRVLNGSSSATLGGGLAASAGGGITLVDSTVSGNASGGDGGGVYLLAAGALSIQGTTIAQNSAVGGKGGGGWVSAATTLTITNSTISGNSASGSGVGGGGLSVKGTATGTIRNVTFVDNDAPTASAILNNAGGVLTVVSTIVAGTAANHCGGTGVTSGGSNLDSNGSCAFAGPGDQNNVDPKLGPLADNGGPTLTHLPANGSPVVDHGASAGCLATDQRGKTRPEDGDGDGTPVCDVGAVEAGADLCPNDPAKSDPGICGCGVADDAAMANGTPDCFINGELKARIARAKAIIGSLSGDQDPTEAELKEIGGSLKPYLTQFDGKLVLNGKKKKVLKLAKSASKAIGKVTKAKAGKKLDKAKSAAIKALDKLDATIAPQA